MLDVTQLAAQALKLAAHACCWVHRCCSSTAGQGCRATLPTPPFSRPRAIRLLHHTTCECPASLSAAVHCLPGPGQSEVPGVGIGSAAAEEVIEDVSPWTGQIL